MIVGVVQMDIAWGDREVNFLAAEGYISENLSMADIIILPEMFSTGFSMNPLRVGEEFASSPTLLWMQGCAVKYKKAIVGSVPIKDGEHYYNRLFFVKDDGSYEYYDKRHLFRMADEEKVYKGGNKRVVIEYKGVRFLPLVCYDLRFPVWSRNVANDYDVMIYIASWPDTRIAAWDTLLKARAIENSSYVIGVNRVGEDKVNKYNGHSVIVDYLGCVITTAEGLDAVIAKIDIDRLNHFRENFPVHLDSDEFLIDM